MNARTDRAVPYTVTDLLPVPYRVRVGTPSHALRSFVVPRGARTFVPVATVSALRVKAN